MMGARTLRLTILAAAMSVVLSACANGGGAHDAAGASQVATVSEALAAAKEQNLDWEISILEDGEISASDYEQAYDRYMECQRDLGYVFDREKYLDPVEGQRWQALSVYRGTGEAPMDDMQSCDERIFLIETPFVLTTSKRMDPQLLAKLKECLDGKGVEYEGDEVNFNDFTSELADDVYKDQESPHTSCLLESAYALYPDLIAVGYGR